jgi:peptidoglycan/LPS O-acetylase OafA/YrhL
LILDFKTFMRKFVTLDGLRGVAALYIAFRHAPFHGDFALNPFVPSESYLAVDFFFALSGFVLCHAYQRRLSEGLTISAFLWMRWLRLYPLYFLALVLALPLAFAQFWRGAISGPALVVNAICGLLLLPSPASLVLFPMNTQAWSLFLELVANGIFGFVEKRAGATAPFALVAAAGLVLIPAVVFGWLGFGSSPGPMDAGGLWSSLAGGFVRVMYSFFAGALVYRIWRTRPAKIGLSPYTPVVILASALSMRSTFPHVIVFDLATTLLVFPLIIYVGASSMPGAWTSPIFAALGRLSYPLYILQAMFFGYALHAAPARLAGLGPASSGFLSVALVSLLIALAFAAEKHFDRPARWFLSRLDGGPRAPIWR